MLKSRNLSYYIGELVKDFDLRNINQEFAENIKELLFNRKVVFFEDQYLSKDEMMVVAEYFKSSDTSRLESMSINNIDNPTEGTGWHSDHHYRQEFASCTMFQIDKVPSIGGDTLFCDMASLYQYGLSNNFKKILDGLTAHNEFVIENIPYSSQRRLKTVHESTHPIILETTYNEKTIKGIFVNECFTQKINNLPTIESKAILNCIFEQVNRYTEYHYRHTWKAGQLVMWNNRLCQHKAVKNFNTSTEYRSADRIVIF